MNDETIIYKEKKAKIVYSRSWKLTTYQYAQPFVRLEDYERLKEKYDALKTRGRI